MQGESPLRARRPDFVGLKPPKGSRRQSHVRRVYKDHLVDVVQVSDQAQTGCAAVDQFHPGRHPGLLQRPDRVHAHAFIAKQQVAHADDPDSHSTNSTFRKCAEQEMHGS